MTGLDLYQQWQGAWSFTRTIHDHLKSETLQATGQATFTLKDTHALLYREEGLFTTSPDRAEFFRQYLYVFAVDNIQIYFADGASSGQLFQTLQIADQSNTLTTDRHICGGDHYDGIYTLTSDYLIIRQHASGPRKNYDMTSLYQKKTAGVETAAAK